MIINVKEPWWSAWQKFGWEKGMWGVGINAKDIQIAQELGEDIHLAVGKKSYLVKPDRVKEYAETNNTKFRARWNTTLYVVPEKELL